MKVTTHSPGSFCTSVLRTRDPEHASAFYSSLMGWTFKEAGENHEFIQWQGRTVASMLRVTEGKDVWVPHVSVENIEKSTAEAKALGVTLINTADIEGVARTATFRDAEGTTFGLWQPAPHQGADFVEEPGSLWWIEILSKKPAVPRDLYSRLFGWTPVDTAFDPFASYTFFRRGEVTESGILPIEPSWGIGPRWNSIFAVENCDAIVARALQLGADEEFVHTVPKAGRIGVFNDPGGAAFLIRGPVPDQPRT